MNSSPGDHWKKQEASRMHLHHVFLNRISQKGYVIARNEAIFSAIALNESASFLAMILFTGYFVEGRS